MARLPQPCPDSVERPHDDHRQSTTGAVRIKSEELFRHQREVEIEHQGRIYRLRVTQLNKLILTA